VAVLTARITYSKKFKLDAVSWVLEQGYTQAEAAKNLGINPNIFDYWTKEFESDNGQASRGNDKLTPRARGDSSAQSPG